MKLKKAAAALLASVLILSFCGCKSSDYRKAKELANLGNYADALSVFETIDDYKDSTEYIRICKYNLGSNAFLLKDYETAKKYLAEVRGFQDSDSIIKEIDYQMAVGMMKDGLYDNAISAFEELGDYEGSKELILECQYCIAEIALNDYEFDKAKSMFEALADYKDSSKRANEVGAKHLAQYLEENGPKKKKGKTYILFGTDRSSVSYELALSYAGDNFVVNAIYMPTEAYGLKINYEIKWSADQEKAKVSFVTDPNGMEEFIDSGSAEWTISEFTKNGTPAFVMNSYKRPSYYGLADGFGSLYLSGVLANATTIVDTIISELQINVTMQDIGFIWYK